MGGIGRIGREWIWYVVPLLAVDCLKPPITRIRAQQC